MAGIEKKPSILLLDDEPLILRYLNSSLESEGYSSITQVQSGEAASAAVEQQPFSILISDVYLPDIDGRDLALRFLELNPGAQVVLMTGFSPEDLDLPAALQGRVQVLEKPFTSQKLIQALAEPRPLNAGINPSRPGLRSAPQTHLEAAVC